MDYESFSARLYSWLNSRYAKEFEGFEDYDDIIIELFHNNVRQFFLNSVHQGIVRNVFEAQPIEDVCEWLLNDEEALEYYFTDAVKCAQRIDE